MAASKRFYRDVSVMGEDSAGYSVLLDGKAIRTPASAGFAVPTRALAEAVAEEWRVQGEKIRPETMMLTKLANTAIDRIGPDRRAAVEQVLAFAKSDLVCYRAPGPDALVRRQMETWDALVEWARDCFGAHLICAEGLGFVSQTPEALAAFERAIAAKNDFALAGLHAAAILTGSAVIALALAEERLSSDEAFAAAELDEIYQAEKWGKDEEALRHSRNKASELSEIASFLNLASVGGNAS
jgi:chaperone required for assembly of F1-ATPase